MTVTIQIGNTDNKLSQQEWAQYVADTRGLINRYCTAIHFFGGSSNWEVWQNVAWVFEIDESSCLKMKYELKSLRSRFLQDSIAITEGTTQFI